VSEEIGWERRGREGWRRGDISKIYLFVFFKYLK
jgi:hypothetical protein